MEQAILLLQIIVAILLIFVVIIQQKGAGLGSTFGGELGFYRTRRGAEKLLFYATILLSILFITFSLIGLLIS